MVTLSAQSQIIVGAVWVPRDAPQNLVKAGRNHEAANDAALSANVGARRATGVQQGDAVSLQDVDGTIRAKMSIKGREWRARCLAMMKAARNEEVFLNHPSDTSNVGRNVFDRLLF